MSHIQNSSDATLRVLGYCDLTEIDLLNLFVSSRFNQLRCLGGEYTLVYQNRNETIIVTSDIGAIQYFYYYDGNQFCHGDNVLDIARRVGLEWEWDFESLGDLCELENLTENRTLHRSIKRVPPGTLLKYRNKLDIYTKNLLDGFKKFDANPVDAITVFNSETEKWVSSSPFLSLSGGFDSRVILSSLLKQDIFPTVVTVGREDSSDVKVARSITRKYGLEHRVVALSIDDFLAHGERIAAITNGSKPACHWNTYLYPKKASVPRDQSFYVGTLGEFARSYYFDKGLLALFSDVFADSAQQIFWKQKILRHRTFRDDELAYLVPELSREINTEGVQKRARRNSELSRGNFLEGGTRYYLEQRVPNFYSNGIRLYNDTSNWRSPFHNREWLRIIWSLSESWKLGSNWHRLAITRNFPDLLSFPEEKGFSKKTMGAKAPPFYWLPFMQRLKYESYDLSENWYATDHIKDLLLDNISSIDSLIDKKLCERILVEHREKRNRTRTLSFLLTLLYFNLAKARGV